MIYADDASEKMTAAFIGGLLVVVLLVLFGGWLLRRRRENLRSSSSSSSSDRLSRSSIEVVREPLMFGGGSLTASLSFRRETVAYGYLGVVEEYHSIETGAVWSVLNLTLPGWVPFLVLDHRQAVGRPSVPAAGGQPVTTGDPVFDGQFVGVSTDAVAVQRILTPAVRSLLGQFPLQRVSLSGRTLLLRTFDQNPLSDTVLAGLDLAASEFLSTAPSFVMVKRSNAGDLASALPVGPAPLPEGFYGPEETTAS